jgi:two-component system OmpR family sensor kinase
MRVRSLRFRMMLLFCAVVGVLLTASYLAFYALFSRHVRAQMDRQILNTASPVMADLASDPTEQDVNELNVPGEYFELLDRSGRVLQSSVNLQGRRLDLGSLQFNESQAVFVELKDAERGRLRLAAIPFRRGGEIQRLVLAMPTRDADRVLGDIRGMILVLLPLSLLVAAATSAWYVGRSLRPVAELTRHAAEMTGRVADPSLRGLWQPLAVRNAHDELGRLAQTFNLLFERVDAAMVQLREFVSDASHEMRTPLSVLQGETELLLAEPRTSEEYQKALRVIDDELKKLSRMVEGLFTLAIADAGELRLASEPLYLNEVLEEACARAAPLARAKEISVERALDAEVPYRGDETFLRQLFLILLDNAIKYSSPGRLVRVSLERQDSMIRARFEDQGMGISPAHLPHIFERFYRAAPAADDAHSGGLGLAIAQAIARAQNGSIECQSQRGSGSTFIVNLPLPSSNGLADRSNLNRN